MSVNEVVRAIEKEVVFFDESGGGVTFSGYEPFMQPQFLDALLTRCQEQEIYIRRYDRLCCAIYLNRSAKKRTRF